MRSPQAFLGLLQLFTFALLCHLVSSQDYWPYGNKKTKKVECLRAAFHPGKTWDQKKYIYGGGKCWRRQGGGGYNIPCLYVQTNEIKMPSYFKTDPGRHKFLFYKSHSQDRTGSGHEECVAACLKHTGCQFITIGWSFHTENGPLGFNDIVTTYYCKMYKILWSSTKPSTSTWSPTKPRDKMTKHHHQDLITVRDNCKLKDAPAECCSGVWCNGYRGTKATTESGRTCQAWNTQIPHRHDQTPQRKTKAGLDKNYCRNPDGTSGGAWCFTTDQYKRWEYCGIPKTCPAECCSGVKCNGYRGLKATTESGRTCQAWNTQSPHHHDFTPQMKTNAGLDKNYCRNPSGASGGAWCYTMDQGMRWEYCGIPKTCPDECCSGVGCLGVGNGYRGTKATTESGRTCQAWNTQSPHPHPGLLKKKPNSGLDKNYCRNPTDASGGAWCYTMDKGKRWEYCDIQNC